MTTKTKASAAVTLRELARHLDGSVDRAIFWVEQVGGEIHKGWLDQECVTPAVATKAVEACRNAKAEAERLEKEYAAYVRDRKTELDEAGDAAFQETIDKEFRRERQALLEDTNTIYTNTPSTPSPRVQRAAREARDAARQRFEQENSLLPIEQWSERSKR
jgi:hypothetical protein